MLLLCAYAPLQAQDNLSVISKQSGGTIELRWAPTTFEVRSSGKYLAKDKIQAFVAGCMSAAASKFILWRYDSKNWNKDWSEFFNEITTKINDPESYAFDF